MAVSDYATWTGRRRRNHPIVFPRPIETCASCCGIHPPGSRSIVSGRLSAVVENHLNPNNGGTIRSPFPLLDRRI